MFVENVNYILLIYPIIHFGTDTNHRATTAIVKATAPAERNFLHQTILFQILINPLFYPPVPAGKTGTPQTNHYSVIVFRLHPIMQLKMPKPVKMCGLKKVIAKLFFFN